jgi:dTDP-4-amino-4,6-dideoxygalactose transaminase
LRAGGAGHAAAFSFYPAKNLGALGDAGALVTRDADLASRVRRLLDHGRTSHYDHEEWGYNFRMDALQAAFLAVKLPHLDAWNDARRRHVASYRAALSDLPVLLEPPAAGETHVHHIFAVRTGERDALLDHLRRLGVGASVHYPIPLHLMEAYRHRGGREGDFPVVERAARMLLSLPVFAELTEAAIAEVVRQVRGFIATARGIQ